MGLTWLGKAAENLIKILEQVFQNPNTLEIAWAKAGGAKWQAGPDWPSEGADRSPTRAPHGDLRRRVL
jgi:hypothetical protein